MLVASGVGGSRLSAEEVWELWVLISALSVPMSFSAGVPQRREKLRPPQPTCLPGQMGNSPRLGARWLAGTRAHFSANPRPGWRGSDATDGSGLGLRPTLGESWSQGLVRGRRILPRGEEAGQAHTACAPQPRAGGYHVGVPECWPCPVGPSPIGWGLRTHFLGLQCGGVPML